MEELNRSGQVFRKIGPCFVGRKYFSAQPQTERQTGSIAER